VAGRPAKFLTHGKAFVKEKRVWIKYKT
jgi:hypothetical protein